MDVQAISLIMDCCLLFSHSPVVLDDGRLLYLTDLRVRPYLVEGLDLSARGLQR